MRLALFLFGCVVFCHIQVRAFVRSGATSLLVRRIVVYSGEDDEKVRVLVSDDEWLALRLELTEAVRKAIEEESDMKPVADIEKRVESEIARLRGKDSYEVGDLSAALSALALIGMREVSKKAEIDLDKTQKEVDLISSRVEAEVTSAVQKFTGKDDVSIADVSVEIDRRVKEKVSDFTGKPDYSFGDISKEVEERRREWVKDFLGADAADRYQFGDITRKAIKNFTGKDSYEFGDISRKLMDNFFPGGKDDVTKNK